MAEASIRISGRRGKRRPECFVGYVTQGALRIVGFIVSDRRAGQFRFCEHSGDRSCIGTVLSEIEYFALAKVDRQLPYDGLPCVSVRFSVFVISGRPETGSAGFVRRRSREWKRVNTSAHYFVNQSSR